jgi:hypothetical protein
MPKAMHTIALSLSALVSEMKKLQKKKNFNLFSERTVK